jgi:hypothetical protein
MNTGIDYGRGTTNIDPETGIRYGVINQNEVLQAWADSADPVFPESENEEDIDDFIEPDGYTYNDDGYICEQFADDPDIFVCKSPYYTYCAFCSPCAPGAGYLLDKRNELTGIKTYCFGHDWFEDEKAPYPVFSVETDELISA